MMNMLNFYQQKLNLQNAAFVRIVHEDAIVAVVYQVIQPCGKKLILKICDRANDYLREVYFLKYFASKIPVPKIIHTVDPSRETNGAILMEYLPGTLLKANEVTEELAHELGCALARIHLNRLSGYGDPIQGELFNNPKIYFTLKFEEGIEECRTHLPVSLIAKSLHYYESHLDLLNSVDGPCVVHRDFRPGNLVVQESKLQGIIDWAGARASFAEEDFCSLEHGEWLTNPRNKKAFLSGYSSLRPLPNYAHLIPFLRLNKAIATIGFTVKKDTWNNTCAPVYQFNREFLEAFFK